MAFLPTTASFPPSIRAAGSVRAGTSPVKEAGAPHWSNPQPAWPFRAPVSLTGRSVPQGTASFVV